jgi:hypothetical protein
MGDPIHTKRDMLRAGYRFRAVAECKGCGAQIEWWTTTNGARIPYDPQQDDDVKMVAHFATCPKKEQFKSKRARADELQSKRDDAVHQLAASLGARVVIACFEDGVSSFAWRNGIPGEDLKQEAITAANKLRWQVVTHGGKAV